MICVYKILSPDLQECYVGSTVDFNRRKSSHKNSNNTCTSKKLFEKYGFDNCTFVVLEQCEEEQLEVKEQWWMDHSVGLVNIKGTKTFDRKYWEDSNKEKIKQYKRKWEEENKEKKKEYYEANKEKVLKRQKEYYESKKLKSI